MPIESSSNGIHIPPLKHATDFDYSAVVTGIARNYTQMGIAVRSEPPVPGERRADLAGELDKYLKVFPHRNFARIRLS